MTHNGLLIDCCFNSPLRERLRLLLILYSVFTACHLPLPRNGLVILYILNVFSPSSFSVFLEYQAKHLTHTWNSSSTFEGREYPVLPCICRRTKPTLETEQHPRSRPSRADCHVSTVPERFSLLGLPPISNHSFLLCCFVQASLVTEVFSHDALSKEDNSQVKINCWLNERITAIVNDAMHRTTDKMSSESSEPSITIWYVEWVF